MYEGFGCLEKTSRQQWIQILQSHTDKPQTEISPVSFCNFGDFALQTCEQDLIHAVAAVRGVWELPHCNKEPDCVWTLISVPLVAGPGKWNGTRLLSVCNLQCHVLPMSYNCQSFNFSYIHLFRSILELCQGRSHSSRQILSNCTWLDRKHL